jgi:hypothetical protein
MQIWPASPRKPCASLLVSPHAGSRGARAVSPDESGGPAFCTAGGEAIVPAPPLPGVDATAETLEQQNEAQGLNISGRTRGLWDGIQPDYGWGIEVLWALRKGKA